MRATIYTYPWDLTDEGIDPALDTIAHTAGLNSVSLAQSYHVSTYFLPHNPRRPLYWGEEGALYFQPSAAFYDESPIAPLISNVVDGPDYMRRIADKIRERGLDLTSWLVFNYNHYLPQRYPDAAKRDPFGHINFAQLCPASPLVRDYACALCRDIAAQFQPDEFHLESLGYLHFSYGFRNPKVGVKITPFCELLMGLCYCQHCLQRADALGLDGESFRADVAEYLARELAAEPTPEDMQPPNAECLAAAFAGRLQTFLDARVETATSLVEEVIAIANQTGARASFFGGRDRVVNGLDSDRILRNVYMVNAGVGGEPDALAASVRGLRGEFPADTGLSAIINPGGFADSDALGAHLTALSQAGINGYAFYNYGLIRRAHLEWIGTHRHLWA